MAVIAVQVIVDEGLALGLEMPELTQLDSLVRAITWKTQVRRALGLPDSPPPKQQHPGGVPQLRHMQDASASAEEQDLGVAAQSRTVQDSSGSAEQHEQPAEPLQQTPLADTGSPPPAGPVELNAEQDGSAAMAAAEAPQQPQPITLAHAEELAEQGHQLPIDSTLLQQLTSLVEVGQYWQVQASL